MPQSTRRLENEIVPFGTVESCRQGQGSRTTESSESSDSAERSHAFRLQAAHSTRPTSFRAPHFEKIRKVSSLCMCIPAFRLTMQENVRRSARAVARLPSRSASRSCSQSLKCSLWPHLQHASCAPLVVEKCGSRNLTTAVGNKMQRDKDRHLVDRPAGQTGQMLS